MHLHDFVTQFWPSTVDGLTLGAIYALFALGYTLVYGVLKLINFAHSEVFMVGTMAAMWVLHLTGATDGEVGLTLVGALLLAAAVAMAGSAATALTLERVAYRPLRRRGASRLAALISAIGASFVLQQTFEDFYSNQYSAVPRVLAQHVLFHIGAGQVTNIVVLIIVAAAVMMVALERTVALTKLGRGIRAVAQDPETATLMGVNIDRTIMVTFLLGGLMAGVAAVLWDVRFAQTRFDIGFLPGIKAFTAAVLGGIGNIRGALLGGIIIGLLELYGASLFGSQWRDTTVFVVLVAVLLFRPTGLLGESLSRARA
ncbi:MAG TPA: branched-chain amino acid ABC transporter permease [Acidimicrobiales bacterium]|nr:branched-chain amino acid ABC transporter permease [Acidimicrobiales bacterium]